MDCRTPFDHPVRPAMNSPRRLRLLPAWLVGMTLMLSACGPDAELELNSGASVDDALSEDEAASIESELNSPIYDRARAFAARYPKRDGGTWDQWCGSLMVRFGQLPASAVRPSAIAAYRASKIVSTNPGT